MSIYLYGVWGQHAHEYHGRWDPNVLLTECNFTCAVLRNGKLSTQGENKLGKMYSQSSSRPHLQEN